MADEDPLRLRKVLASLQGKPSEDWHGGPGRRFRTGLADIANRFLRKLRDNPVAQDVAATAVRYVEGEASSKYAEAARAFNEAESLKIDAELKRRSLEADVALKAAVARKAAAEATVAEIDAVERQIRFVDDHGADPQAALMKKLDALGVVLEEIEPGQFRLRQAAALPPGGEPTKL